MYDSDQKVIMQYEQGSNRAFKVYMETTETKRLNAEGTEGEKRVVA